MSGSVDDNLIDAAAALPPQITVVKDAITAYAAGGVTGMHDATEGDVLGEIPNQSKILEILDIYKKIITLSQQRRNYHPSFRKTDRYNGVIQKIRGNNFFSKFQRNTRSISIQKNLLVRVCSIFIYRGNSRHNRHPT